MEAQLLKRLRELRTESLLCDASLKATNDDGAPLLAHQAVLAAASAPLREYLVAAARTEGTAAGASPPPTQLELGGLAGAAGALPAALAALYADPELNVAGGAEDMAKLAAAWRLAASPETNGLATLTPQRVCSGLRELRVQGLLCDITVIAADRRFPAHQAVLAAGSPPLRKFIVDKLRENVLGGTDRKVLGPLGLVAEPLELHLEAISQPEAVALALDCIYGSVPIMAPAALQKEEAARDVRQLSASFELPALRSLVGPAPAAATKAAPAAVPLESKVAKVQEAPPLKPEASPVVAAAVALPAVAPKAKARGRPKKQLEPPAAAAPQAKAVEPEEPAEEPAEDQQPSPAVASDGVAPQTAEEGLYALQFFSFGNTGLVPETATCGGEADLTKEDMRLLKKLRDIFDERPVWLEAPLLNRLPAWADEGALVRLLPFLTYQWTDGPWMRCYARLGYDPRADPDEAKVLQVLQFRDPHFKPVKGKKEDVQPEDCTFRRPPSSKVQLYQFIDIHDDFIASLTDMAETLMEVDKRTGWLDEFVLTAARDRLSLKSHNLREKMAKQAAAGNGPASRASTATTGRGAGRGRGGVKRQSSAAAGRAGRGAKRARGGG